MIDKIIQIRGIGLLHDAIPSAIPLRQQTVVYGDNATGKTTFTAIIRSLCSNDPSSINERKTIGGQYDPSVELLVSNKLHKFEGKAWNAGCTNILVFDEQFVDENVYSGSAIDAEHRKHLHQFALGAKGVFLAKHVDELDNQIRDINQQLSELSTGILATAIQPIQIEEFISLEKVADIGEVISEAQRKVDALVDAERIKTLKTPSDIALPSVELNEYENLLARTLPNISPEAERVVKQHLTARLDNDEEWLQEGIKHLSSQSCPFCAQDIEQVKLVEFYKQYFDASYDEYKRLITDAIRRTEERLSDKALGAMREQAQTNELAIEQWAKYISTRDIPRLDVKQITDDLGKLRDVLLGTLRNMATDPLSQITLDPAVRELAATIYEGNTKISLSQYNSALYSLRGQMGSRRQEIESTNLSDAQSALRTAKNAKTRYSHDVNKQCDDYLRCANSKKVVEKKKKQAKTELDDYTNSLLHEYQDAINQYIKQSGAKFEIDSVKTVYTGGKPRMEYILRVFGQAVDLTNKPNSPVRFRTGLSQGDKNTLAFAFFLARLDNEKSLSDCVVLFDDPLRSLDANRRTFTRSQIGRIAAKCQQIIILTHDLDTAAHFCRALRSSQVEQLRLKPVGNFSEFERCDIEQLASPEYYVNWNKLWDFDQRGSGQPLDVARAIRPMLEENLRVRFPDVFKGDFSFGIDVIKRIRTSKPNDPEHRLQPLLPTLENLNAYTWRYHHGNPQVEKAVTESELKTFVRSALEISRGA